MRIKIESPNGEASSTRIIDQQTGADLTACVRSVSWRVQPGDTAQATLEIAAVGIAADEADCAAMMPHPHTGKMTRIASVTFADGEVFDFS
jgi:hypothetical protein